MIRPIHSSDDYEAALAEINRLAHAEPGTDDFDRLDILATLVEAYEAKHFPIGPPDPIDAVLFAMERLNYSPRDLEPYLGNGNGQVGAILSRQKPLTLPQIQRISAALGISLGILAQKYPLASPKGKSKTVKTQSVQTVKHS